MVDKRALIPRFFFCLIGLRLAALILELILQLFPTENKSKNKQQNLGLSVKEDE